MVGCTAPKAAGVGGRDAPSVAQTQAVTSAVSAVAAVARQNPTFLKRFSQEPGKTACPLNIGGPYPGVVLAIECEMLVDQHGRGWVVTLIQEYNFNGPHEFTTTYRVSASGSVSQPTFSGDPVPNIP